MKTILIILFIMLIEWVGEMLFWGMHTHVFTITYGVGHLVFYGLSALMIQVVGAWCTRKGWCWVHTPIKVLLVSLHILLHVIPGGATIWHHHTHSDSCDHTHTWSWYSLGVALASIILMTIAIIQMEKLVHRLIK